MNRKIFGVEVDQEMRCVKTMVEKNQLIEFLWLDHLNLGMKATTAGLNTDAANQTICTYSVPKIVSHHRIVNKSYKSR